MTHMPSYEECSLCRDYDRRYERTKDRLTRALTRAGYAVLKKHRKIPQTRWEVRRLEKAYARILEHAVKLGW